jgi:hypothetical protein
MKCLRIMPYLTAAVLAGFPFVPAQAQRASQHGSVSQRIGNTLVTIEYNRPVARGRELFGALVPYAKIWHPGADEASHITLSTDVKVNGQQLTAGTYSLWTEPNPERWTFIFSRAHPVYHTPYPEGQDALRVSVTPRTGQHMETMAFYFPIVEGKQAELALHWGVVIVPLALEVP